MNKTYIYIDESNPNKFIECEVVKHIEVSILADKAGNKYLLKTDNEKYTLLSFRDTSVISACARMEAEKTSFRVFKLSSKIIKDGSLEGYYLAPMILGIPEKLIKEFCLPIYIPSPYCKGFNFYDIREVMKAFGLENRLKENTRKEFNLVHVTKAAAVAALHAWRRNPIKAPKSCLKKSFKTRFWKRNLHRFTTSLCFTAMS